MSVCALRLPSDLKSLEMEHGILDFLYLIGMAWFVGMLATKWIQTQFH